LNHPEITNNLNQVGVGLLKIWHVAWLGASSGLMILEVVSGLGLISTKPDLATCSGEVQVLIKRSYGQCHWVTTNM